MMSAFKQYFIELRAGIELRQPGLLSAGSEEAIGRRSLRSDEAFERFELQQIEKGTQVALDALPVRAVLGSGPFCLVKLNTVRQISVGIVRPHVLSLILASCPDGVSLILKVGSRGNVICGVFQIVRNGFRVGFDIIGCLLGWAGVACRQ
jgi:hypothetical protein